MPREVQVDDIVFIPVVEHDGHGTYHVRTFRAVFTVTPREAAELSGVPHRTILRLVEADILHAKWLTPRKAVITGRSFNAWLRGWEDPAYWTPERVHRYSSVHSRSSARRRK